MNVLYLIGAVFFTIVASISDQTKAPIEQADPVAETKKCFPDGEKSVWIIIDRDEDCIAEIAKYEASKVVPKLNTCYRANGIEFVTTANCNEFIATPIPKATPTAVKTKIYSNKITCVPSYGPPFQSTREQCDKLKAEQTAIVNNYNNKVNTSPTTTKVDYSTTRNYDYNYDYNYDIAPPPSYAPAPTFKPVEDITSPGVNVNLVTPVPTPKDCYQAHGAVICL